MGIIKVLIADDHLLVRTGITSLLKDADEIEVIAEAENGKEAVEKATELKPDIILMDISMPELSGLDATLKIKETMPGIKILILTMHQDEEYIFNAIKLGASGIIHKNVNKDELVKAITSVYLGKRYFGTSISEIVMDSFFSKFNNSPESKEKVVITKREKEVLHLVAKGFSNQEIADSLRISSRTVDSHKSNLMQKLNIKTSAALAKYAIENDYER